MQEVLKQKIRTGGTNALPRRFAKPRPWAFAQANYTQPEHLVILSRYRLEQPHSQYISSCLANLCHSCNLASEEMHPRNGPQSLPAAHPSLHALLPPTIPPRALRRVP